MVDSLEYKNLPAIQNIMLSYKDIIAFDSLIYGKESVENIIIMKYNFMKIIFQSTQSLIFLPKKISIEYDNSIQQIKSITLYLRIDYSDEEKLYIDNIIGKKSNAYEFVQEGRNRLIDDMDLIVLYKHQK